MTLPQQLVAAINWFRVAYPMHCYYCGLELVVRPSDSQELDTRTYDHVIPRFQGGR
jgi:hypothetical protein